MAKVYTNVEKAYIMSKIRNIKWDDISESLRKFWVEWRNKYVCKRNNN